MTFPRSKENRSCEEDSSELTGFRYWGPVHGTYRVREVFWFIKRGDPVCEGKPVEIEFTHKVLVSAANLGSFTIIVWCDEVSAVAPVHMDSNGRTLVTLKADLSNLSAADAESFSTFLGADGKRYYQIPGTIEATFYSASTKYELVCKGQRYDTVTAEYV